MIIWKGLKLMTDNKGEQSRTEDSGTLEGLDGTARRRRRASEYRTEVMKGL